MARYETEDGEPLYGKRLSPEELAAYLHEQRLERSSASPADSDWQTAPATTSFGSPAGDTEADRGGSGPDPYARAPGDGLVRLAAPLPPVREYTGLGADTGFSTQPRARRRPWRMAVIGLVLLFVVPLVLGAASMFVAFGGSRGLGEPLGEAGTVYLEQGTTSALYTSTFGGTTTDCTVTAPSGDTVALTPLSDTMPYALYALFEAPGTGTFTVTCPAGTSNVVIGPPLNLSRMPLIMLMLLIAGVSGLVGLVVTILATARLLRYRSLERTYQY